MSPWGPGCAKNAQNRFLYCLLPIDVTSTFGFQIDEIEKDFLRANSTPEFSHSLGRTLPDYPAPAKVCNRRD
jgi:hypothetical protein